MPAQDRRAAARRKAWGRGPMILRLESLENRRLLTGGGATQAASVAKPDLVLTAFDTLHNLDHGDPFVAVGRIANRGRVDVPAGIEIDVYASTTPGLNRNAVYVGTATLDRGVTAGAEAEFRQTMFAPPADVLRLGQTPSYYLVAVVDPSDQIAETIEANNGGTTLDPVSLVTVTPRSLPVLSPGMMTATPSTLDWGGSLNVAAQVANNAGTSVPAGRARVVLAPEGQPLDGPNVLTIGEFTTPAVGVAQIAQVGGSIRLPANPPAAFAGATRFTVGVLADVGSVDAYLGATTVQVAPGSPLPDSARPDLSVVSLQPLDTELTWSMPFQVKATVENHGQADSGPVRVSVSLIDANRPELAPLTVVHTVLPGLQAGYQQEFVQTVDLKGKLPVGLDPATVDGRIVVRVDPENAIDEPNELDNGLVSTPVRLKLLTRDGRSEIPKEGPVTRRDTPSPAPAPSPEVPAETPTPAPTPPVRRPVPQRPTREELAERLAVRRALLTLRTQQQRLNLRVFRDRAHNGSPAPAPHLIIPPAVSDRPRAS